MRLQDPISPLQDLTKAIKSKIIKPLFLVAFFFFLISCMEMGVRKEGNEKTLTRKEETIVIDSLVVAKTVLILNPVEGKWYYNDQPYNGYSLKLHSNGKVAERLGFYKGKREGIAKRWSKNGTLRVQCCYDQNNLVGVYKSWWENGALAEESNYVNGLKHGMEKTWYPSGQLAKLRQLANGKEAGMQKAWLQNGTLYVNYEAKNGRIFGLKRSNLCYQVENEVVVRN